MPFEVQILSVIFGVPGVIVFTTLIIRFKLKKKELEMRSSDPELGPEVDALRDDLNDTRAQLAEMQEPSTSQSVCSPPGVRRKRTEVGDRLSRGSRWQTSPERPSGVRGFRCAPVLGHSNASRNGKTALSCSSSAAASSQQVHVG